jgi:hypothetical protein
MARIAEGISTGGCVGADVIHIGCPKTATTFIARFLESQPEVTIDHHGAISSPGSVGPLSAEKPLPTKIHVSRRETLGFSLCVVGDVENWRRNMYVPDAWDLVKKDIELDPGTSALRLQRSHPNAKILLTVREQVDWLHSAYKYSVPALPATGRSFNKFCATPMGIVYLQAGHFDRTITAYLDVFGTEHFRVLRFEDIVSAPKRFAAELCAFIGIPERPIPQRRENESNAQMARLLRWFPIFDLLPRKMKYALKPYAERLPAGRSMILSSREIRMIRSIYAASNQRTEKLLLQLSRSIGAR